MTRSAILLQLTVCLLELQYGVEVRNLCLICWSSICSEIKKYEGWNFNSGNYLFTTGTK